MPKIRILRGDITQVRADAIVNPANERLLMGGGVAGAIKRAGGEEIEKEAVEKGPIRIGEAIETSAGRLRARYVIHAPTVRTPGGRSSPEFVRLATKAALDRAEQLKLRSIAFPAMGSGVGGVPVEESVRIILEESIRSRLDETILVAWNEEDFATFKKVAEEMGVPFEAGEVGDG